MNFPSPELIEVKFSVTPDLYSEMSIRFRAFLMNFSLETDLSQSQGKAIQIPMVPHPSWFLFDCTNGSVNVEFPTVSQLLTNSLRQLVRFREKSFRRTHIKLSCIVFQNVRQEHLWILCGWCYLAFWKVGCIRTYCTALSFQHLIVWASRCGSVLRFLPTWVTSAEWQWGERCPGLHRREIAQLKGPTVAWSS